MTAEAALNGIRAELRLVISQPPEQRFTPSGGEVLQLRGTVQDDQIVHPEVIVRFGGQRRSELYRWAQPGKHLTVQGRLEVKSWSLPNGQHRLALLIEAQSIQPLNPAEPDLSHAAIYALDRETAQPVAAPATSRKERAAQARRALERMDG